MAVLMLVLPGIALADCPAIEAQSCRDAVLSGPLHASPVIADYSARCAAMGGRFVIEETALRAVDPGRGLSDAGWLLFEQGISCTDAPICAAEACETLLIVAIDGVETVALRGRFSAVEPDRGLVRRGLRVLRSDCAGPSCWDRYRWQDGALVAYP